MTPSDDPPPELAEAPALGCLCLACGTPLRDADHVCPACGVSAASPPRHWGMLTPFGYGLCALIGAVLLLAAVAMSLRAHLPRPVVVLGPLAGGAIAAWLAAGLGKRLVPQLRCSYEHLLLSGALAGTVTVVAAFFGMGSVDGLLLVWGTVGVVSYLMLRQYGYRAKDIASE